MNTVSYGQPSIAAPVVRAAISMSRGTFNSDACRIASLQFAANAALSAHSNSFASLNCPLNVCASKNAIPIFAASFAYFPVALMPASSLSSAAISRFGRIRHSSNARVNAPMFDTPLTATTFVKPASYRLIASIAPSTTNTVSYSDSAAALNGTTFFPALFCFLNFNCASGISFRVSTAMYESLGNNGMMMTGLTTFDLSV